jgi:hypothetical protein
MAKVPLPGQVSCFKLNADLEPKKRKEEDILGAGDFSTVYFVHCNSKTTPNPAMYRGEQVALKVFKHASDP